jgi:polysaccharide biosynthesis/export protein
MKMKHSYLVVAVLVAFAFGSCSINKNIMFRTDTEYTFDKPDFDSTNTQYKIAPNDFLSIHVFSGKGAMVFDYSTSSVDRMPLYMGFDLFYVVRPDGTVDLPIIGVTPITGLTIPEAQEFLAKKYTNYVNPFVILKVLNRRCMVFTGEGSIGTVVPLLNPNITLIEAIALAGGIQERGNAAKIKLIRRVDGKDFVYRINLRTIEGIQDARTVVQAGDIIYVEPVPQLATEFVRDLAPIVSLVSSTLVLFFVITN